MPIKVFVSHSSDDETLASALVDFLMSSADLSEDEIRCTSVPGHKLPVGSDTALTLRDELSSTSAIIGLITRHSISSAWVLFELGAAWGAKKKLKPLVTDDIEFKDLPGPISGQHVARLSSKPDLSQFVDELCQITGSQKRSSPKVDSAIDKFISSHKEHMKSGSSKRNAKRVLTQDPEPSFAGIPYSELESILKRQMISVPPVISNKKKSIENSLFDLFVMNYKPIGSGIRSDAEQDTGAGFLYNEVCLRLLPYGLVKFDKLTAAQAKWFKRLVLSENGQKFIAHYFRRKQTS